MSNITRLELIVYISRDTGLTFSIDWYYILKNERENRKYETENMYQGIQHKDGKEINRRIYKKDMNDVQFYLHKLFEKNTMNDWLNGISVELEIGHAYCKSEDVTKIEKEMRNIYNASLRNLKNALNI